jgi:2-dehydro-3-deoxyphosphogluconate aldolase/(4S)-4-hydroxy-2-oxoglutarate aldolase
MDLNLDILKKLEEVKIIPVTVIENLEDAIPLGKILVEVGLPVIEITFRAKEAEKVISLLTERFPELLIGAGTILKLDQVNKAISAGAKFIVTPGFNPKIVDYCIEKRIIIIPGVNTPTMVEWALDRGLKVVKFFPADLSGGTKMLKALIGPYPEMRFIPTGGVNNRSLMEYLELENVMACGGSWIVNKDLILSHNFQKIKELIKEALSLIKTRKN